MGLEDIPEINFPEQLQKNLLVVFERAEISFGRRTFLGYVIGKSRDVIYLANDGIMIDGKTYALKPFEHGDITKITEYKKLE